MGVVTAVAVGLPGRRPPRCRRAFLARQEQPGVAELLFGRCRAFPHNVRLYPVADVIEYASVARANARLRPGQPRLHECTRTAPTSAMVE
jgi:hypothetical protein